jgi:hypothetical protein
MIRTVLVCASLLGATSFDDPKTGLRPKGETAPAPDLTATLARYNALREQAPETAAAQWNLALWCEKNGLKAEAFTHFSAVVRRDPTRDAAWRKLGLTKRDGRWLNADEVAEDEAQKKADKVWAPRLKKIHKDIHSGGKRQDAAEEALIAIEEPRAVPAVFHEFGNSGPKDQLIAVRALGHIQSPLSSRLLAMLAVYGRTAEVRRQATESLRGRDAEEYLEVLVGLMADTLKYEVRPVGGPGSPGVLMIDGKEATVRRVYYPPPPPNFNPLPGDLITYDNFGMPVIERPMAGPKAYIPVAGTYNKSTGRQIFEVLTPSARFSATEALIESQNAVASARSQLESDVAALDELNDQRKRFNELVIRAAKDATGKNPGDTPVAWRDALPKHKPYGEEAGREPTKPTFDELIPLAYRPTYVVQHLATWFKSAPAG